MARLLFRSLTALLLFLASATAQGQKLDRGIDLSNQPCVIKKGTWMVGGGASYMLHNNDNSRLLVVNGIKSTGYTISVSPAFCYMFKDNIGVGVRVGYKRNMLQLDSAKMSFDDINMDVANFHKINHAFEIQGIGRYYIPVGSLKRIGLFNELQLAYSYGQGKVLDGHDNKVNASYETSNSLGINVCPGFMAFVTDKLAIDVSVNMMGLHFDWTDQKHNQVADGNRSFTFINFKVTFQNIHLCKMTEKSIIFCAKNTQKALDIGHKICYNIYVVNKTTKKIGEKPKGEMGKWKRK